jgi:hypothetical protein
MSRPFWAGVMVVSLGVTGGAGFYVYSNLSKISVKEVPLQAPTPAPKPVEASTATAAVEPSTPTVAVPVVEKKEEEHVLESKAVAGSKTKREVTLKYKNSSARTVAVIGDFNKWTRKSMKRSKDVWQISIKANPGKYEFMYVIDGNKRVIDPNFKTSDNGKSLLVIEAPKKK